MRTCEHTHRAPPLDVLNTGGVEVRRKNETSMLIVDDDDDDGLVG